MFHTRATTVAWLLCVAGVFATSDDRFIKKYAMMKIYESCFGTEVVKQIRQEMKDAYAKCSAPPSVDQSLNPHGIPPALLSKLPPGFAIDPNSQTITKPSDSGNYPSQDNDVQNQQEHNQKIPPGVLAFRPQAANFPQQAVPPYMVPSVNAQFRPFSAASPFYQFPYSSPNMFYPPGLQYNPYGQFPGPYQQVYQQPYFGSHRMSRDMDLRERLDLISRGANGAGAPNSVRPKNITCVMQELGYIDSDLEPNYEKITARIASLPVSADLKGDIQDGLQFCQKFAQCVPDVKRDVAPLSQELVKPMFFFRCYKHKKLEACIMKDIRERFTSEEELETDTDFRSLGRSARSRREDNDPRYSALDEMAVYMYDFINGDNAFDFDLYM